MFVGRKVELDSLNNSYKKNSFQFPVIYGRRRVGKSTLINEFSKGKKSIYFVAIQSTGKENLELLSIGVGIILFYTFFLIYSYAHAPSCTKQHELYSMGSFPPFLLVKFIQTC